VRLVATYFEARVDLRAVRASSRQKETTTMDTTLDSIRTASATSTTPAARRRWPGRVLTGLPVAFLAFDAAVKFANPPAVTEATAKLGLSSVSPLLLGVVLAACLALYVARRTAPLGAVLLTGYLGGAVLSHLRVGDPLISHTLFPIYIGALLWAGLYLRDDRVRRLLAAR
jgi:hypothetical protein